jgi:ribonuclease J
MKLCIHRGTREIGGTCVEIESSGARILLDLGLPLTPGDEATVPLPAVSGLLQQDPDPAGNRHFARASGSLGTPATRFC